MVTWRFSQVRLEVNGVQYDNFVSASCNLNLDALSNSFNFEAAVTDGRALPFKGGEECKIYVDDEPVLTGYIEIVQVNYSSDEHTVTISGRDKTADIVDSTLNQLSDIRGQNLTLKSLIEIVIGDLGLNLSVVDEVNPEPFTGAEDIASPEPGENAFEFIEKYARKRHVLLTSNANGNIVITSNQGVMADGAIQNIIGATDNNVIKSTFTFDISERFNIYKMVSNLNPTALNLAGDVDLASVASQGGGVSDNNIRQGRQLILSSEASYSNAQCEERAKWEADVRRARGLEYSVDVDRFRVGGDSGDLWQLNRLYQIVDDFVGKIEPMLCNRIEFSFSVETGSRTSLQFVGEKAYTNFEEPDRSTSEASNVF